MANPYTRFAPTQYQSQYVPAPLEQIVPAMQYASGLRQESELADARTKKLVKDMLGSAQTPEELALVKKIEEDSMADIASRAERGYSSQDAIEVELQAEEAADALGSITSSREAVQEWDKEMRELNQDDVSPRVLETLIGANRPQISYDLENKRATAQSASAFKITPDLDLAAHVAKNVKDIQPILRDQGIAFDERTGQFVEVDPDGNIRTETVSPQRVRRAASAIIESSEAQDYLARERTVNQIQAQQSIQQGVNPVDAYLDKVQVPDDAPEELKVASKDLQNFVADERAKGRSDAEIYATIKEREEINNALGFANTKYAYTDLTRSPGGSANRSARTTGQEMWDSVMGPATNNPAAIEFKSRLGMLMDTFSDVDSGQTGDPASVGFGGIRAKEYQQNFISEDTDPREWAESEEVVGMYGKSISKAMDMAPKEAGESNEVYMKRILGILEEKATTLESVNVPYEPILDEEEKERINERLFGPDSQERLGDITEMQFAITTAGQETEVLTYDGLLDHLGISAAEAKEKLFQYADVKGYVTSNDPQLGSAFEISAINPDDSWFSDGGNTLRIRASRPEYFNQGSVQNQIKISNLRTSPAADEFTFTDTMTLGNSRGRYRIRAVPRDIWGGTVNGEYQEFDEKDINLNDYYSEDGNNRLSFRRRQVVLEQLDNEGNVIDTITDPNEVAEVEKSIGL